MKTSFKTIAFAFAFFAIISGNVFADDKESKKNVAFETGIFASKSGKIHIAVDKYLPENTTILVSDEQGKVVYREYIGKSVDKYRTSLDVKALPSGKYTIEVSGKGTRVQKEFELKEQPAARLIAIK